MSKKITLTISLLLFIVAAVVYLVPLSEGPTTITATLTTSVTAADNQTITHEVTSKVQITSPLTYTTIGGDVDTLLDREYYTGPTRSEFSYKKIKDLRVGDSIIFEVHYPYRVNVKLVDPYGKKMWSKQISNGGIVEASIEVSVDGIHTLWVNTYTHIEGTPLRVKIMVAHSTPVVQITETIIESERSYTTTLVEPLTTIKATTLTTQTTTHTQIPLTSRGILTPLLVILGLVILLGGFFYARKHTKPVKTAFCVQCGKPIYITDKFCEHCGAKQS